MKGLKFVKRLGTRIFLIGMFLLPLLAGFTGSAAAEDDHDRHIVYTITNAAGGNEVVLFGVSEKGMLSQTSVATGGLGSGAGLGSQSSVILSQNNRWLFAAMGITVQLHQARALKTHRSPWKIKREVLGL